MMKHMKKSNKSKKVVIVGAGPGGLSAGMLLAHQGFDVEIYEKNERVGGRNANLQVGKYSFDTGPTFLMMKFILDEMFAASGRKSQDYLKFTRLDPMYRLFMPKEKIFDVSPEHAKTRASIAKLYPGNEKGFDRFLKKEKVRADKMFPCLRVPYSTVSSMFSRNLIKALPHLSLTKTIHDIVSDYFPDEDLQLAFTFQTKYLGMSPWHCPAAFMILPFVEHDLGIYHVEGGLNKISEAMAKVVTEEGGKIFLGKAVKRILTENRVAKGIELEDGKKVMADNLIINADFAYAMTELVEAKVLRKYTPKDLAGRKYSCSTFMLYLGLDKVYDQLSLHNIVFADDYHINSDDIFIRQKPSEEISYYVRNSSILDPAVAPSGHSQLYILIPTPNNEAKIDWQAMAPIYREKAIVSLEQRIGLKDIRSHIQAEKIITPTEWQGDYNVYKGATFNLAHSLNQMLYFRPHNKFQELENCYIVGGGTHPGSGLPTIYESGRIAADYIIKNKS